MSIGEDAVEELKHFFHEKETELEEWFENKLESNKEKMEEQPYSIECSGCGDDLNIITTRVDSDNDLWLTVEPCEFCLYEIKKKYTKEAKE